MFFTKVQQPVLSTCVKGAVLETADTTIMRSYRNWQVLLKEPVILVFLKTCAIDDDRVIKVKWTQKHK